jgi:hypothetical protein
MTKILVWICLGREGGVEKRTFRQVVGNWDGCCMVRSGGVEDLAVLRSNDSGLIETTEEIFLPICVYCCFELTKLERGGTGCCSTRWSLLFLVWPSDHLRFPLPLSIPLLFPVWSYGSYKDQNESDRVVYD